MWCLINDAPSMKLIYLSVFILGYSCFVTSDKVVPRFQLLGKFLASEKPLPKCEKASIFNSVRCDELRVETIKPM